MYPYSELFWSAFSPNAGQNNSEYGHFLRSDDDLIWIFTFVQLNVIMHISNSSIRKTFHIDFAVSKELDIS